MSKDNTDHKYNITMNYVMIYDLWFMIIIYLCFIVDSL